MCRRRLRLGTVRMSVDLHTDNDQPAPSERVLFWVYQAATWVTLTVIDDAAMLALVLS